MTTIIQSQTILVKNRMFVTSGKTPEQLRDIRTQMMREFLEKERGCILKIRMMLNDELRDHFANIEYQKELVADAIEFQIRVERDRLRFAQSAVRRERYLSTHGSLPTKALPIEKQRKWWRLR